MDDELDVKKMLEQLLAREVERDRRIDLIEEKISTVRIYLHVCR